MADRNLPACCRGKGLRPGMRPLTSTPDCCQPAPFAEPSPSPIEQPVDDTFSYQEVPSPTSSPTAGQRRQPPSLPYPDLYQEREDLPIAAADSGRCPAELLGLPPPPGQLLAAPAPAQEDISYSIPSSSCAPSCRSPEENQIVPASDPGLTQPLSPPSTPEDWITPMIPQRDASIRRFTCKRRLTFHDVKEWVMRGTETVGADAPMMEGPKVEAIKGEPPPGVLLEYQSRELAAKPDDGCMETIYGPLPQHKYVPMWVYWARENNPEVFQEALTFYFERTGWPELSEMDADFQEECEGAGVVASTFKRTVGFAPVWVFILDVISKANVVERRVFDTCIDEFFEYGSFPELSTMPEQLLEACEKMNVSDYDFYAPDM